MSYESFQKQQREEWDSLPWVQDIRKRKQEALIKRNLEINELNNKNTPDVNGIESVVERMQELSDDVEITDPMELSRKIRVLAIILKYYAKI